MSASLDSPVVCPGGVDGLLDQLARLEATLARARHAAVARQPASQLAVHVRSLAAELGCWEVAGAAVAAEAATRELLAGRIPSTATWQRVHQRLDQARTLAPAAARDPQRPRGLLVSADDELAARFHRVAEQEGFTEDFAVTPTEALGEVASAPPAFALVDATADLACTGIRRTTSRSSRSARSRTPPPRPPASPR